MRVAAGRVSAPLVVVLLAAASMAAPGAASAAFDPAPGARAAVLVEQSTGQRLFARAADQSLPVASATKLMTALVTLEHVHRLATVFTQNLFYPAAVDSQIGLVPGERMSVHDLLLALMLPSADDAAEDLADNVGHGSVGGFVAMMNARARQLGLTHTHYSTPIGLDTAGNFSSAGDLVRLAIFLRAHSPFFKRIVALPRAVLHTGNQVRVVLNRNGLVARFPWINGVKTGHTLGAGYVLVASATRGSMTLLSAVLGTDSETARDDSTLALLGYGFRHFRLARPVAAGVVLAQPTAQDRPGVRTKLVAAAGFSRVISDSDRVSLQVRAPATLAGPLARRSAHGYVQILVDGRPVGRVALLLAQPLAAVSPLAIAARFLLHGSTLVGLLALCGVGAVLAGVWRRRWRERQQAGPVQA